MASNLAHRRLNTTDAEISKQLKKEKNSCGSSENCVTEGKKCWTATHSALCIF